MTLLDRQKEFTSLLVKGFPKLGLGGLPLKSACAVTGNATQENLVKAVTTGPKDHGSDGTLQWRLDRLDGPHGLKGWSAAQGMDWATLEAQAAFFLWELHRDYPALERDLRAASKSIETLTANICKFYERPNMAVAHLDKRISHAKSVYKIMSAEQNVWTTTAAGSGAAIVIGGATVANASQGGSLTLTMLGALATGLAAIAGPLLAHFSKPKPQATPAAPAPSQAVPPAAPVSGLQEALDHMRSCKAALDDAVAKVAIERTKVAEQLATEKAALQTRIDALHVALEAAEAEAAEVVKETAQVDAPAPAAPAETAATSEAQPS